MCSSDSDFKNDSFETDESDEFPSENELSEYLISCPISSNQIRKKMLQTL